MPSDEIIETMARAHFERGAGPHIWTLISAGSRKAFVAGVRAALSAAEAAGWVMVPKEPSPAMIAAVAVRTQPASAEDYDVAAKVLAHLPPTDNPGVADVLGELVRDYRAMIEARP